MKLSSIIGKQVFVVYDAMLLGTIHDVAFNNNYTKILGFYFFDQEENEYYLKTKNIYSINDFVVIKNTNNISNEFLLNKPLSPLGKQMVSTKGENYGILLDMQIDDKFNIENFESNTNKTVCPTEIVTISNNIVLGKNIKLSSFKPKKLKNNGVLPNLSVSILKIEPEASQKLMPSKITVNSDILIGKKLSKNIIGKNNELILKQNQVLTAKQVILAKQHDKLNELFYSVY